MIRVEGVRYSAGAFRSGELNLSVGTGEYFVLMGPTGSGKTLLLQCLCGLLPAEGGTISVDGRDVTALEPRRRGIGYVPQDAGLFSHLSVEGNLAFPLRVRGLAPAAARREIAPIVEALCLGPLMGRSTVALSGGERQKVAVARALAMRPKLMLLDEPASALDAPSREHLCRELHRVQRQFGIVTIHVCHNLDEAASVADRAAVMSQGRLIQTGAIDELLRRPASEVVARLMGNPNVFVAAAAAEGEGSTLTSGAAVFRVAGTHGGEVRFTIRPEAIEIVAWASRPCVPRASCPRQELQEQGQDGAVTHGQDARAADCLPATLERRENRGPYCRLEFAADLRMPLPDVPGRVVVHTAGADACTISPGSRLLLRFPPEAICVLKP